MPRKEIELTPKHQRFVDEYLVDLIAAKAAVRAGFPERYCRQTGYKLLHDPRIGAAIQAKMDERSQRTKVTADRILTDLARIAMKAEVTEDFAASIRALELLGKNLKMFTDKVEIDAGTPLAEALTKALGRVAQA